MSDIAWHDELIARLNQLVPDALLGSKTAYGELTLDVVAERIVPLLTALRDECEFKLLIDICGVDWPARGKRFDVVYHLLSLEHNIRVRLKAQVGINDKVPSATGVFPTAGWFERETYDLYGVIFDGHPDLRRILTDYGFEGHPLRKDFPLTGFVELRYDDDAKQVAYKPVELVQDYRDFDFESPWEGMLETAPKKARE
jgi:NADH-quinone oxidoreductase subunit C